MNKIFKAKINVNSATKKQKEGSKVEKKFSYLIIVVLLLLVIIIAGSSYAYFSTVATSNNNVVSANSKEYEIVYRGGTAINANITL